MSEMVNTSLAKSVLPFDRCCASCRAMLMLILRLRGSNSAASACKKCGVPASPCWKRFMSFDADALLAPKQLTKDVVLFKYENAPFYRRLTIFGGAQFIFWTGLSYMYLVPPSSAATTEGTNESTDNVLPELSTIDETPARPTSKDNWLLNFARKFENFQIMGYLYFAIGYGCLSITWLMALRSVRLLVLRKGGREVSFVTYAPFGASRIVTVPLSRVTCPRHRGLFPSQVPVKVSGKLFHYTLDKRGTFVRPDLFDITVGMKRS